MSKEESERRKCGRTYFFKDSGLLAIFRPTRSSKAVIVASILNIGEGGVGLSLKKGSAENLNKGDRLRLTAIKGTELLQAVVPIEMEIMWLAEYEQLEHIGFGCQFIDASEAMRQEIRAFMSLQGSK